MKPPQSLSRNIWFNLSLWGSLIVALIVMAVILANNDLRWCFEISCFSNVTEIYEFPIGIASAGIALAAFIAVIHRSDQTRHQIEIAVNQNVFKNFLDHRAEFFRVLDVLTKDENVLFKYRNHLYEKLFPKNNMQNVELISSSRSDGKSRLLQVIERHNILIQEYNEILRKSAGCDELPANECARWMPNYLLLAMDLCVYPTETRKISATWSGFISSELFIGLPKDMDKFMYAFENVLSDLVSFCFPNDDTEIFIDSRDDSEITNKLVDIYCAEEVQRA